MDVHACVCTAVCVLKGSLAYFSPVVFSVDIAHSAGLYAFQCGQTHTLTLMKQYTCTHAHTQTHTLKNSPNTGTQGWTQHVYIGWVEPADTHKHIQHIHTFSHGIHYIHANVSQLLPKEVSQTHIQCFNLPSLCACVFVCDIVYLGYQFLMSIPVFTRSARRVLIGSFCLAVCVHMILYICVGAEMCAFCLFGSQGLLWPISVWD